MKTTSVHFRVTEEVKSELQKKSLVKRITVSDLCNEIINQYLNDNVYINRPLIMARVINIYSLIDNDEIDKDQIYRELEGIECLL